MIETRAGFWPADQFPVDQMVAFMRRPDVYWPLNDGLSPPPEVVQFEEHLLNPKVLTIGCMYGQTVVGFVQFQARTSVGAEMTAGFHPQARGKIAKTFCQYAIQRMWTGSFLSIWALVPSDNQGARVGCRSLGFEEEGRLRQAIARLEPPSIRDIIIYGLHRPGVGR